jgi:hypothetical protein
LLAVVSIFECGVGNQNEQGKKKGGQGCRQEGKSGYHKKIKGQEHQAGEKK